METQLPESNFNGKISLNGEDIPCAVVMIDGVPKRLLIQREMVGVITGTTKGGFDTCI